MEYLWSRAPTFASSINNLIQVFFFLHGHSAGPAANKKKAQAQVKKWLAHKTKTKQKYLYPSKNTLQSAARTCICNSAVSDLREWIQTNVPM